jgi:hypothetical protein
MPLSSDEKLAPYERSDASVGVGGYQQARPERPNPKVLVYVGFEA